MAQAAKKQTGFIDAIKPQAALRLIKGNAQPQTKKKGNNAALKQEATARSIFNAVIIFAVLAVVLGLGPVVVNAEATRASQASIHIKEDISRATAISQELELQRSQLRGSARIEAIAKDILGMVPITTEQLSIEIGTDEEILVAEAQNASDALLIGAVQGDAALELADTTVASNANKKPLISGASALTKIADLTLGEASTLLVGDISLASSR